MIRAIIVWPLRWWHAHQRAIDPAVLWPICRERAENLDHARAAFAVHAYRDAAWLELGEDEIYRRITELT